MRVKSQRKSAQGVANTGVSRRTPLARVYPYGGVSALRERVRSTPAKRALCMGGTWRRRQQRPGTRGALSIAMRALGGPLADHIVFLLSPHPSKFRFRIMLRARDISFDATGGVVYDGAIIFILEENTLEESMHKSAG